MRRTALFLLCITLLTLAAPGARGATEGCLTTRYVLPAVARTEGLYGSYWLTDLMIVNPYTWKDLNVWIAFLETGKDNTDRLIASQSVPRGGEVFLRDVVDFLFGKTSSNGALLLYTDDGSTFIASSRTYTGSPGTYGLCENAQSRFARGGDRVFLPGMRQGGGFRTNTGVVNGGPEALNLTLRVYGGAGNQVGTTSVTLKPWSHTQLAISSVAPDFTGHAVWSCDSSAGTWMAYATVIDNASNDSVFVEDTPDDACALQQSSYDLTGWWEGSGTLGRFDITGQVLVSQHGPKIEARVFDEDRDGLLATVLNGYEDHGSISLTGKGALMACLDSTVTVTGTTNGSTMTLESQGTGCFSGTGGGTLSRKR